MRADETLSSRQVLRQYFIDSLATKLKHKLMNPTVCRFLSNLFFQGGIISIVLSIAVWWFFQGDAPSPEEKAHAERFGIFVGLWAPTLLILSNRFDRFADKAPDLPGYKADIDTESGEEG